MAIAVNGVEIADSAIDAEVQYHPAASLEGARRAAAQALVVREVLLDEARRVGIAGATDEATIEALLAVEVPSRTPDEEACRRYYENNRQRFQSRSLFEAQHILIAADPGDAEARAAAREKAGTLVAEVTANPERFADLARTHSDCPSKDQGGHLGQVTRGSTVPEFETFLFSLDEGEICAQPVESRYGYHVLRLLHRSTGREMPYESVRERIADYLRESSWRTAVRHYIQVLLGRAAIDGIDMGGASSPLLQ
ncbi:MAG TPA: peptidylprolyl isomerase [Alphaproteobacteria bacterium]|nr:peptidylprolyl isomerase [Alphaproteobacteria bacterium]